MEKDDRDAELEKEEGERDVGPVHHALVAVTLARHYLTVAPAHWASRYARVRSLHHDHDQGDHHVEPHHASHLPCCWFRHCFVRRKYLEVEEYV